MAGAPVLRTEELVPGLLTKEILEEGTGTTPQRGDSVVAHYTGRLLDGSVFDSSVQRGTPFKFTIGEGQVIKGWDEGFATMRKGEKAFLVCGPAFAYGPGGSPPKIPANATLRFEVELLSFGPKPKEPWQMSNEEKLNVAEAAKAEGNAAFSAGGREADALEHYKRGLACLEQADDVDGKVHTLRVTFHSNSAAVHLRLQAYADAAKSASAALKLDASHPKSLFRRGTAHTKLGNFAEAKADLGEALRLSPGDAGVKAELAKLAEAVKAERAREKAAFGGIFSK